MKRMLLSILVAVVATGANAQFKGSVNMNPESRSQTDMYVISFNFATVCKQMEVNRDEFYYALLRGWRMPNPEFKAYLLTDGSGANCFGCDLTLDGMKAAEEEDRWWHCEGDLSELALNQLNFVITPVLTILPEDNPPQPKEGDKGHAVWVLDYQGKIATFDLSVNFTKEAEPPIAIRSLEKVGEETLTGTFDYNGALRLKTVTDKITALFGGNVEIGNLHLYVMADEKQEDIVECSYYSPKNLNIDATVNSENSPSEFFCVEYAAGYGSIIISAPTDAFQGGQKSSGSVFLVADGKYYELKLDIQFGYEYDDREGFDIVETVREDVQLMFTDGFFTYYDRETYRYGLVSTDIDLERVKGLLGTETPVLYAEQKDGYGSIHLTRRYNAAPGQGFWFTSDGGQCYRQYGSEMSIGTYYTEGGLKWYECPSIHMNPGNKYQVNLYLANPENGKAVKYEISVEIVEDLQSESVAYVRSLPVGLGSTPDGIGEISRPNPSRNGGECYDLQGRKLQKAPERGLYIQDGKIKMVK